MSSNGETTDMYYILIYQSKFCQIRKLHCLHSFQDISKIFYIILYNIFQVILAIIAIIIQYIIPCIIVLICYILICYYLSIHRPEMLNDARQKIVLTKRKRNNQMLMLVATAHFLSWLPLNVVNLIGKK